MTETVVKQQIKTIERATQNAVKSKDSALRFLQEAGIVKAAGSTVLPKKKK